jgi:hypothetical protein
LSHSRRRQTALAEADHELQANNDQPTSRFRYYLNLVGDNADEAEELPDGQKVGVIMDPSLQSWRWFLWPISVEGGVEHLIS